MDSLGMVNGVQLPKSAGRGALQSMICVDSSRLEVNGIETITQSISVEILPAAKSNLWAEGETSYVSEGLGLGI